jgi:phosphate transport system ATP-binding protein
MSHFINNKSEQVDKANTDDAYTLGPLQAGPPCCDPEPLIRVKNLSLHYGEKPALEDVSLDIYKGCITALIGPSGCGKTSFLSVLNRMTDMIPDCRVSGTVHLNSWDVLHPDVDVQGLRRDIGMIFQKPVPFPLSIRRNFELPLREHGMNKQAELNDVVQQVLQDVGLWEEVIDQCASSALALSGGQQQRLCIARALALWIQKLIKRHNKLLCRAIVLFPYKVTGGSGAHYDPRMVGRRKKSTR